MHVALIEDNKNRINQINSNETENGTTRVQLGDGVAEQWT